MKPFQIAVATTIGVSSVVMVYGIIDINKTQTRIIDSYKRQQENLKKS